MCVTCDTGVSWHDVSMSNQNHRCLVRHGGVLANFVGCLEYLPRICIITHQYGCWFGRGTPPKKHHAFQLQPNPTQPGQPQNESKQQKTPSLRAPAFLHRLDASVPRKDINRDVLEVNGLEVKGSEAQCAGVELGKVWLIQPDGPGGPWISPMVQMGIRLIC